MKWILYAEQPPPLGEPVLVVSTEGCYPSAEYGTRYKDGFELETGPESGWLPNGREPKYWMPLPELPEAT